MPTITAFFWVCVCLWFWSCWSLVILFAFEWIRKKPRDSQRQLITVNQPDWTTSTTAEKKTYTCTLPERENACLQVDWWYLQFDSMKTKWDDVDLKRNKTTTTTTITSIYFFHSFIRLFFNSLRKLQTLSIYNIKHWTKNETERKKCEPRRIDISVLWYIDSVVLYAMSMCLFVLSCRALSLSPALSTQCSM